jgi:hypothetical protein
VGCSICGKEGHNARSCQQLRENQETKEQALWVKFDNITRKESSDLLKGLVDVKDRIAPDARATFARGNIRELPDKIKSALSLPDPTNE